MIFVSYIGNLCLTQGKKTFSYIFSEVLQFYLLTFRSMIHFKLIVEYSMK